MKAIKPVFKYVTVFLLLSTAAILSFSWEIPPDIEYVWNMDSPDEYIETNMKGTISNGVYTGHNSEYLADPYMSLCVNELGDIRINGDKYTTFRARIYLGDSIPDKSKIRFYFRKGQTFYNYRFSAHKGWHEYKVDMKAYPEWNGVIDSFRLDFVEGMSTEYDIKIDWIRFAETEHGQP